MNNIVSEIMTRAKERSFYFSLDENGGPTLNTYGDSGKNPEVFIEQRPDHSLTKIHFDGMSGSHPNILPALDFVLSINQDFANSQLRFDNNPKITLKEFIKERQGSERSALPDKLYHGTSLKAAMKIVREGLLPREITGVSAKYMSVQANESQSDRVYLCTKDSLGPARFAAAQAAAKDNSKPVILEIDTTMLSNEYFAADEDSKSGTWEDSIAIMGSASYVGSIGMGSVKIDQALSRDMNPENTSCSSFEI